MDSNNTKARTSSRPDSRQSANVDYLKKRLSEASQQLKIESGAFNNRDSGLPEAVRAITTTLGHWITTEYKQESRTTDDQDMDYFNRVVFHALDVIEFIVRVSDCQSGVTFIEEKLNKEVGHE